jgi:hypothetical protein
MIRGCFISVLLLFLLTGCANVFSTQPIGDKPYQIKEEDWKGVWFNKDATVSIKVVDGCNGVIKIAWVEWKDNEAKLEYYEVQLRQFEKWVFGNVKDTDVNGKGLYLWAPIKLSGDQLIYWRPNAEKFRALGKNGKLPCREEGKTDCILGDLSPDHLKIMTSQTEGLLYEWDEPVVFVRIIK